MNEFASEWRGEWHSECMNTHQQQSGACHGSWVDENNLEEFACSMPDSLHHLLTKAGRRVILHAAA